MVGGIPSLIPHVPTFCQLLRSQVTESMRLTVAENGHGTIPQAKAVIISCIIMRTHMFHVEVIVEEHHQIRTCT